MDADMTHVAAGDQTGAQVKLFDAAANAVLAGPAGNTLGGVTSLALAFPLALAGSVNDLREIEARQPRADGAAFLGLTDAQ